MNVFVPLFMVLVAVCWFLVYTGRAAPTDPRLLLFVGGAVAAGAASPPPRPMRWRTRRVAKNVLLGEAGGAEVFVFDLLTRHVVRPAGSAGRGSNAETVVCARVPGADLPRFALAPKGFWPWLCTLAGAGIRYVHLEGLGGRRQPPKDSRNVARRNKSLRAYADHMETAEFREGVRSAAGPRASEPDGDHVFGGSLVELPPGAHRRLPEVRRGDRLSRHGRGD